MVKAENVVIGIFGHKGSGKTTTGVMFFVLEGRFEKLKKVFSNIKVDIDNFAFLKGHDMIDLNKKLDNSIILIDELHEYADSRSSGSFQNKRVSDFFLQSRHTQSNIYYTTQYKDQIDKRIRRITDIDIVSENLFIDSDNDGYDDLFKITMTDHRRPDTFPIEIIYCATPIFEMFDSTDRVNPFVFSKKQENEWLKEYGYDKMP